MNMCACGEVNLRAAYSIYTADDIQHFPADLICIPLEGGDLLVATMDAESGDLA